MGRGDKSTPRLSRMSSKNFMYEQTHLAGVIMILRISQVPEMCTMFRESGYRVKLARLSQLILRLSS